MTTTKPKGMAMKEFIVYKGDQMVAVGTAEDCAAILGVKPSTIRWHVTPTGRKRQAARKKQDKVLAVDRLDYEE